MNEKLPELKAKHLDAKNFFSETNRLPFFDIVFFETDNFEHIISLLAEYYAIEKYLSQINYFETEG
jgi:hypothetical protein